MSPEEIMVILNQMVGDGKLDKDVVHYVAEHLQDCWVSALGL